MGEPNVYVQLRGETDVLLIPQNFSDVSFGSMRLAHMPALDDVKQDPWWRKIAVPICHLSPGDGVTFPGHTYHMFATGDTERIAMNFFFIPRWRKMEYTPYDWYSVESSESMERLALRQLWARSFVRLYEDTGLGPIFIGAKLEYL